MELTEGDFLGEGNKGADEDAIRQIKNHNLMRQQKQERLDLQGNRKGEEVEGVKTKRTETLVCGLAG